MAAEFDEVIHIKIKKCIDNVEPEYKKMSIDPHITNFDILRRLVSRAFNINGDFTISYLTNDNNGRNIYLSMLSDWDLDAAFMGASNPCLNLKVELKNLNMALNDWTDDLKSASKIKSTSGSVFKSLSNVVSTVSKSLGFWNELSLDKQNNSLCYLNPLADYDFRSYQDPVGNITREADFRIAVYKRGVETCLRKVVWRHLLNIYPRHLNGKQRIEYLHKKSEEYRGLRLLCQTNSNVTQERRKLLNSIRKDVLRTDRNHVFYGGNDENENLNSLFNLLVVYAITHPSVGYCQGMSDIASPLLYVQKDEAVAYMCFCSIMRRLRCNFSLEDDQPIITKFAHLSLVLRHHDIQLYEHLSSSQSDFFFCYRWILLEMKREFPLDDALMVLEVMWASLASDPPTQDLSLFDSAYIQTNMSISSSSIYAKLVNRRLSQMRRTSTINPDFESSGRKDSELISLDDTAPPDTNSDSANKKRQSYSLCDACSDKGSLFCPHSDYMTVKDPSGQTYLLPPPSILGHGNPFLMFLCVALLLQHRERILHLKWDYEDVALFFDRMVRKHDSIAVLRTARQMYDAYNRQHTASQTDQA